MKPTSDSLVSSLLQRLHFRSRRWNGGRLPLQAITHSLTPWLQRRCSDYHQKSPGSAWRSYYSALLGITAILPPPWAANNPDDYNDAGTVHRAPECWVPWGTRVGPNGIPNRVLHQSPSLLIEVPRTFSSQASGSDMFLLLVSMRMCLRFSSQKKC